MPSTIVNALVHEPPPVPATALTTEPRVEQWRGYVGAIDTGKDLQHVFVQARISVQTRPRNYAGHRVPGWRTTAHEEIWRRMEASFIGYVISPNKQHILHMGQVLSYVEDAAPHAQLGGLCFTDRTALVELWARWHLNASNMACAHQPEPDGENGIPQCVSSGYVYGSARLIEPLDPHVRTRIRQVGVSLDRTLGTARWPEEVLP